MSRQARAHEFSAKERQRIKARDNGQCIFCSMDYHMEKVNSIGRFMLSIMHYIPRAKGGLGIAENGAIGCQCHHDMMDNGKDGYREEMLNMFKDYLMQQYPDWNEKNLVYKKYDLKF